MSASSCAESSCIGASSRWAVVSSPAVYAAPGPRRYHNKQTFAAARKQKANEIHYTGQHDTRRVRDSTHQSGNVGRRKIGTVDKWGSDARDIGKCGDACTRDGSRGRARHGRRPECQQGGHGSICAGWTVRACATVDEKASHRSIESPHSVPQHY